MDYTEALHYARPGTTSVTANTKRDPSVRPLNGLRAQRKQFDDLHAYATAMTKRYDKQVKELNDIRRTLPFLVSHSLRVTNAVAVLVEGHTAENVPVFAQPLQEIGNIDSDINATLSAVCRHLETLETYIVATLADPHVVKAIAPVIAPYTAAISVDEIASDATMTIRSALERVSVADLPVIAAIHDTASVHDDATAVAIAS